MTRLSVVEGDLGICRLAPDRAVPQWAVACGWWSITRTAEELSVVAPLESIPPGLPMTGPWRAFGVEGPLEHDLVGVLSGIAGPLAAGGVSIFAVSTFDTDYVLVPAERLEDATRALRSAGHTVTTTGGRPRLRGP
ncbi:MAG TPA: ACT domain-containing protein [Acidimicrobiales bacterium]|nr:ACT domain-containing protein [Acidimicrobiales bacterium]